MAGLGGSSVGRHRRGETVLALVPVCVFFHVADSDGFLGSPVPVHQSNFLYMTVVSSQATDMVL